MPTGPKGQKRPADVIGNAVRVMLLANDPDAKQKSSYQIGMNELRLAKRVQIRSMLCEGANIRFISRVADCSINTVSKML